MTDTSTEHLPSLIDDAEGLEHNESEVPALSNDVLISMPAHTDFTTLTMQYIDDVIQYNTMDLDNASMGMMCMNCHLSYYGFFEEHMHECYMHGYCEYHRRWEGPRHGNIRCDTALYQRDRRPPAPKTARDSMGIDTGTAPDAYFGWSV
jgi:hypothetical protein